MPAKHLLGLDGVSQQAGGTVDYVHIMFAAHEIVMANGALSESFFPGEIGLSALEDDARAELHALFPYLGAGSGKTAALCLRASDATVLRDYMAVR